MSRLAGVLRSVAVAAGVLLLLTLASAVVADGLLSEEVQLIVPKPPEVVALDRELWEKGQPVAGIYGTPVGRPLRVVLPDGDRLVRPKEDPRLPLLPLDRQRGENPLQVKTVWFAATRAAAGLTLVAVLSLLGAVWLRRRGARRERREPARPAQKWVR